ncbi:hypothetical protein AWC37_04330 [Staphylococcus xylosus]|jgi:hypothetical protein|uniref:hypothetical protein n=1 Tax=Staphylococcus xylosus TaxID=1288 RepID=UPI0009BFCD97|nr:hypothetical protein [Staphylococcus xylosus]ARD74391.1 hypothetical protein AWC37_04330 [Staphylococcus xylosus]
MYSLLELEKVYRNLKEGLNRHHNFKFDTLIIVATITVATNHICKAIENNKSKNDYAEKSIKKIEEPMDFIKRIAKEDK